MTMVKAFLQKNWYWNISVKQLNHELNTWMLIKKMFLEISKLQYKKKTRKFWNKKKNGGF